MRSIRFASTFFKSLATVHKPNTKDGLGPGLGTGWVKDGLGRWTTVLLTSMSVSFLYDFKKSTFADFGVGILALV